MNENDDDDGGRIYAKLDETLRRFLGEELDGQLGRARTAFETHVTRSATRRPRHASRSRLWVIGLTGAGAAIAASLAAVWAVPMFGKKSSPTAIVNPVQPSSLRLGEGAPHIASAGTDWQQLQQVDTSDVVDQGTLVVNGAPARVVKSRSTQRTEWLDRERNIHMETTVPQERVMLIGIDTY
jgi:hypothetical protein